MYLKTHLFHGYLEGSGGGSAPAAAQGDAWRAVWPPTPLSHLRTVHRDLHWGPAASRHRKMKRVTRRKEGIGAALCKPVGTIIGGLLELSFHKGKASMGASITQTWIHWELH
eukprot:1139927-Pelagomonas_calceolata.AAC.9